MCVCVYGLFLFSLTTKEKGSFVEKEVLFKEGETLSAGERCLFVERVKSLLIRRGKGRIFRKGKGVSLENLQRKAYL